MESVDSTDGISVVDLKRREDLRTSVERTGARCEGMLRQDVAGKGRRRLRASVSRRVLAKEVALGFGES